MRDDSVADTRDQPRPSSTKRAPRTFLDTDRWEGVADLFQSALEKPAGDREVFLRRACLGDTALFDEVLTLLQAHEEAGSFLGEPLVEIPRHLRISSRRA